MTFSDTRNEPARAGSNTVGCRRNLAFGWGLAAGIGAAMGVLVGRKALVQAKVGRGHSMKHRALDLAASVMQPKYPIEAVSTFLNGFHFYADDMGRQIEAHHFCIHLRHDLHQCTIFDSNQPGAGLIGIEYRQQGAVSGVPAALQERGRLAGKRVAVIQSGGNTPSSPSARGGRRGSDTLGNAKRQNLVTSMAGDRRGYRRDKCADQH